MSNKCDDKNYYSKNSKEILEDMNKSQKSKKEIIADEFNKLWIDFLED